jgi:hypothetical protein
MKQRRTRWGLRVILAGGVGALAFAALTSVGAAVSPSGTAGAAKQYNPKKVTICHHTHSKKNPFVTIRVSQNALKAHLKHGDTIGPCSGATFTLCAKGKTTKVKGEKKAEKLLRKQAKLGKCKTTSKGKSEKHKGKSDENKQKGKSKNDHGKPAEKPGKGGEPGKPADTPGKGPKK